MPTFAEFLVQNFDLLIIPVVTAAVLVYELVIDEKEEW